MGVWGVGSRLVACEASFQVDLTIGDRPRTWLISSQRVEEDASLLPSITNMSGVRALRYLGRYPDDLRAVFRVGYDEDETDQAFRYLGRGDGNRYVPADCLPECSLVGPYNQSGFARLEPRCDRCDPFRLYVAEERIAWEQRLGPNVAGPPPPSALLFGHGGPDIVVDTRKMALWTGTTWIRSVSPWCSVDSYGGAVRLSNGASLVLSHDCDGVGKSIFWISPRAEPHLVNLMPIAKKLQAEVRFRAVVELNHVVWIIGDSEVGTVLLSPLNPSEVTRPAE